MSPKRYTKAKFRGQANSTALQLFGVPTRMESKEDRESIALVLRLSANPRMRKVAEMALLPEFRSTSFAKLAENEGLNFHSISSEYKEIKRSEGFIRAAQHLPDLMEQTAVDAKSKWETCRTCKGTGHVTDKEGGQITCSKCETSGQPGKVYVLGDADRLKLIFETFGLTGKGGGLNVNLDLRRPPEPHESMSALSESIAPILEGTLVPEKGDPE